MDYYDTIIQQRTAAEAAQLLADECRKKDKTIGLLKAVVKLYEEEKEEDGDSSGLSGWKGTQGV